MEYFTLKDRCELCRSRRFYEEDGLLHCKQGHRQPRGQRTETGDETFVPQSQKSRIKKQRQEKVSTIQRGTNALLLYLQAYQLILWKQCHALIHTVGLTPEIEAVVKELWALRLQLYADRLSGNAGDTDTVFSSQSAAQPSEPDKNGTTKAKWKGKHLPTLIETLALCYLAAIILRLPVTIGDLHRYAVREDVPFIRAIRQVPHVMKKGMPAEYMLALDTLVPLAKDQLRKAVHDLALLYQFRFELGLPALNVPLMLFRCVRELAIPLAVYQATRNIARLLDIDFSFSAPEGQQRVSASPEIALLSIMVIAVKLYYPFDSASRHVNSAKDPAVLEIDWDIWLATRQAHESRLDAGEHLPRGSEINITEDDVMGMTGEQMDDYLDWYERTWVDEERAGNKPRAIPQGLLDMFPTGRADDSLPRLPDFREEADREERSQMRQLEETMAKLRVRSIKADIDGREDEEDRSRPVGALYKRYRTVDDLTLYARAIHEAVAELAAMKLESLLTAVSQIEIKLLAWRKRELKGEIEGMW